MAYVRGGQVVDQPGLMTRLVRALQGLLAWIMLFFSTIFNPDVSHIKKNDPPPRRGPDGSGGGGGGPRVYGMGNLKSAPPAVCGTGG